MELDAFTGGIFDTNCFYIKEAQILIDAPQDAAGWIRANRYKVQTLLLTHGHIDHVWDAAQIKREHGCQVGYHPECAPMLTVPDFFKQFGFNWEIEPVNADFSVDETDTLNINGLNFAVLHVPGHCPGSVCYLNKTEHILFGGDVLFAGSIGRTDLPGGDHQLLLRGIREKLWKLDEDTTVLPGHGPATKIGIEKRTNPFLL